jgi:hypothetical protein
MTATNKKPRHRPNSTGANIMFRGNPLLILNSEEAIPFSPNLNQKPAGLLPFFTAGGA